MTDNASSFCSGGIIVYSHRLLVVLVLISASRAGWKQSRDIVWYVDPTSTADPETCSHEAYQPCSSLVFVLPGEPAEIRFHSVNLSSANFAFYLSEVSLQYK